MSDVTCSNDSYSCIIIIEIKHYSHQSYLVAERAVAEKSPIVFITDKHCDWARKFTTHVLAVTSEVASSGAPTSR